MANPINVVFAILIYLIYCVFKGYLGNSLLRFGPHFYHRFYPNRSEDVLRLREKAKLGSISLNLG
jgi:hypothetical protein